MAKRLMAIVFGIVAATNGLGSPTASAQIKPESSGHPAFNEPEPNPHGAGEYHPNEPRNTGMSPRIEDERKGSVPTMQR